MNSEITSTDTGTETTSTEPKAKREKRTPKQVVVAKLRKELAIAERKRDEAGTNCDQIGAALRALGEDPASGSF